MVERKGRGMKKRREIGALQGDRLLEVHMSWGGRFGLRQMSQEERGGVLMVMGFRKEKKVRRERRILLLVASRVGCRVGDW